MVSSSCYVYKDTLSVEHTSTGVALERKVLVNDMHTKKNVNLED